MRIFFLPLVAIAVCVVGLQACCKQYCYTETLVVRYINFQNTAIDSVLFIGFRADGTFSHPLDSFYRHTIGQASDTIYDVIDDYNQKNFSIYNDWKIIPVNSGKEYLLSSIRSQKRKCSCTGDYYYQLTGYKLNDSLVNSVFVDLLK